jgi:hypothetical protein
MPATTPWQAQIDGHAIRLPHFRMSLPQNRPNSGPNSRTSLVVQKVDDLPARGTLKGTHD